MNAMNNFTISGFVVKDAEVKNFEKSSIARFGLSFKTSEKNGNTEVVKSAIVNIETWIKNDDAATQEATMISSTLHSFPANGQTTLAASRESPEERLSHQD